jgi:hypothetical protein
MHSTVNDRNVSNPRLVDEPVHLQHSQSIQIPATFVDRLSPTASSQNGTTTDKSQTVILALSPPSLAASHSIGASPAQPVHQRRRRAVHDSGSVSNAQLTDEQIDLVGKLSSANLPATDIARLVERMRAGEATSGQGSVSGERRDRVRPDPAPPSYDDIEG